MLQLATKRRARLKLGMVSAVVVLALAGAVFAGVRAAGVWINATPSMPEGLYRLSRFDGHHAARGSIVAICPSAAILAVALPRRYLAAGPCPGHVEPLLKHVAAIGGDAVVVTERAVRVNGRELPDSGRFARDCAGRPLSRIPAGHYTVPANTVWLYGPAPRSWDSRYFGAQPERGILGTATPLLVIRADGACGS